MRGPKKNPHLREAITLLVAKELTYAQIAKEMGFSRQRVNEITAELGLKPKSGLKPKKTKPPRVNITTPERRKWYRNKYYLEHKEKFLQQSRQWHNTNLERHKTNCRNWRLKNLQRANFLTLLNKTRRRKAPGKCTYLQWMGRVEVCGWKCFYCKTHLTAKTLTMDHRIPTSRNGTNWPANLVPACKGCNFSKHDKTGKEYFAWLSTRRTISVS
jgi:5-methylcytosine-specific restriction endonuclease McrA